MILSCPKISGGCDPPALISTDYFFMKQEPRKQSNWFFASFFMCLIKKNWTWSSNYNWDVGLLFFNSSDTILSVLLWTKLFLVAPTWLLQLIVPLVEQKYSKIRNHLPLGGSHEMQEKRDVISDWFLRLTHAVTQNRLTDCYINKTVFM